VGTAASVSVTNNPQNNVAEQVCNNRSDKRVTYYRNVRRPSWFNIATLPPGNDEYDEPAIAESIGVIESLILAQIHRGVDARRIILVGFSQGAALSLMVALSTLHDLGGVVSLSGWIPPRARDVRPLLLLLLSFLYLKLNRSQHTIASPNVPILWCHGTADTEIPIAIGEDAVSYLRKHVRDKVQFNTYPGLEHTINDDEVNDLRAWLVERIAG
jgi:lysophospholipase-2